MSSLGHDRPVSDPGSETGKETGEVERSFETERVQGRNNLVQMDVQRVIIGQDDCAFLSPPQPIVLSL
jgi:hypothetical protein